MASSSRIQSDSSSPKTEHTRANAVSPHETDAFANPFASSDPFTTDTSPKTEHTRADSDTFFVRGCCCFWSLNCFTSRRSDSWERISASDYGEHGKVCGEGGGANWWRKGMTAIKKAREWSELVAGPRWKTFIRRFNKSGRSKPGKFQYDPFSYALNFDEGAGQIGHFDDDRVLRDFSSRYAAVPVKEVPLSSTT